MHKALTVVNLPPDNRKEPGDKITQAEWDACDPPQTEEDIKALIENGAISEDMDAELHPDHQPVDPNVPSLAKIVEDAKITLEQLGKNAPDELKQLAKLDLKAVTSGDKGNGSSGQNV